MWRERGITKRPDRTEPHMVWDGRRLEVGVAGVVAERRITIYKQDCLNFSPGGTK